MKALTSKITYLLSHHFENLPLFSAFSIMLNGLTFMKHNQLNKNNDYAKGNGRYQDSLILV